MGDEGATYLHFEDIDWAAESVAATPRALIDAAKASGARRKKMATGLRPIYTAPEFASGPHPTDEHRTIHIGLDFFARRAGKEA